MMNLERNVAIYRNQRVCIEGTGVSEKCDYRSFAFILRSGLRKLRFPIAKTETIFAISFNYSSDAFFVQYYLHLTKLCISKYSIYEKNKKSTSHPRPADRSFIVILSPST